MALVTSACASQARRSNAPASAGPTSSAAEAEATGSAAPSKSMPTAEQVKAALTPPPEAASASTSTAVPAAAAGPEAASHDSVHETAMGVEPSKALRWLENGNKRFVKGWFRKDGQSRKDVARLANGQQPHAIVISCSDSRVPPEAVFDQKLGEIFVVRTAGEALDDNVIGSVEYAVEHLGTRLIVVLGHTSCGAVKAAIQTLNGGDAGSPALNQLVGDIHPRIRASFGHEPDKEFSAQSLANAKGVVGDLAKRSEILRRAVESGRVTIKSALYDLGSGEVKFE